MHTFVKLTVHIFKKCINVFMYLQICIIDICIRPYDQGKYAININKYAKTICKNMQKICSGP